MTCAIDCAATIEKKLNQTSGVISATVEFESETAWISYDLNQITLKSLTGVVKSLSNAYSVSNFKNTGNSFQN